MSTRSALLFFSCALAATPAWAVDPFEIQVYEADVNRPGQFGLELHTNYSLKGHTVPEYEGQIAPNHIAHFTLEPALGITDWFELGAYLQFMATPEGNRFGGVKLRGKFVLPERLTKPFFAGINAEIGRVPRTVEEEGWANEFRLFIGWSNGRFLVDINPIVGYALSGPDRFRPDVEPAGKVAVNTDLGFQLGVEYYAGLGLASEGFSPWKQQEHLVFATFDLVPPVGHGESPWELNVGVGRGLTDGTPNHWIMKVIIGRSF